MCDSHRVSRWADSSQSRPLGRGPSIRPPNPDWRAVTCSVLRGGWDKGGRSLCKFMRQGQHCPRNVRKGCERTEWGTVGGTGGGVSRSGHGVRSEDAWGPPRETRFEREFKEGVKMRVCVCVCVCVCYTAGTCR